MTDGPIVYVSESVQERLQLSAARSHPLETGGILIGVSAGDSPWVTEVREFDSPGRGPARFILPRGVTQRAIRDARRTDARLGYLGDWHSHPADVPASRTDLLTTCTSALAMRRHILLLVARRRGTTYALDLSMARGTRIIPCRIIPTGDLPPLAPRTDTNPLGEAS
jgi:integrative and conjugative element protein (TIGR02256 family)